MKNLVVQENETIKIDDGFVHKYNNITINSGGILTCNGFTKCNCDLLLYIENDLIIKNGGCINVSCLGNSGGEPKSTGIGHGAGISCMDIKGIYYIVILLCLVDVFDTFIDEVYYGIDGSIKSRNDNWRELLVVNSKVHVYDKPFRRWYSAEIIEINDDTNEIKVAYDEYSSEFDEWLDRDSKRIAKLGRSYRLETPFCMDKLIDSKRPMISKNESEFPICLGSGGGGGHNDDEFGGNGGGILQINANNIIIENNGGIYCNGGKGIGNAGSGSGGTIYIKCNNIINNGLITSISLNSNFMNIIHIKIYINQYINTQFPNELCNLIKKFISNIDGSGKIFIDCQNEYNKTGFQKKFFEKKTLTCLL